MQHSIDRTWHTLLTLWSLLVELLNGPSGIGDAFCTPVNGEDGLKGDKTPNGEKSNFDPWRLVILALFKGSGFPLDDQTRAPRGNLPNDSLSGDGVVLFPVGESLNPPPIRLCNFGFIGGGGGIIALLMFSLNGFVTLLVLMEPRVVCSKSELKFKAATPDMAKRDDPGAGDLEDLWK